MKNKEEKQIKKLNEIINDLETLKNKIHSDFIKMDIILLQEKLKQLLK